MTDSSDALVAFDCLMNRAGHGLPLESLDVIQEDPEGPIMGRGMRAVETLFVTVRGVTAQAEASLHVIATEAGKLLVRAALVWNEPDGSEHSSIAVWEASREAAERIVAGQATNPSTILEDMASGQPGTVMAGLPGYNALWTQSLPGFVRGVRDYSVGHELARDGAEIHMMVLAEAARRHPHLGLLAAYATPLTVAHLAPLHQYSKYMLSTAPAC